MLLIYDKSTGRITGINTSHIATFENMYPNVAEEFNQKYGGIVVEHNPDYDKNRNWYKVEKEEVVKLDSPWEIEQAQRPDPRDKRIAELENAVMLLINGGTVSEELSPMETIKSFNESTEIEKTIIEGVK